MRGRATAVNKILLVCGLSLGLLTAPALAQQPRDAATKDRPIQDNSFLLEEAYNQEAGVVQHINSFTWMSPDWVYTFTDEWPLPRHARHQLSVTVPLTRIGAFSGFGAGIGDFMLNYRYQVIGSGDARLAFAPRLSLLVPSGNYQLGRGVGGPGLQTNLPFSITLGRRWVTHVNAGATLVPHARNELGEQAFSASYNLGQSVIFAPHPRFNLMLEALHTGASVVSGPGATTRISDVFLNPGFRAAWNFKSGLQVVPGFGIPVGVGPTAGRIGVLFYLSFEHRMWSETQ